MSVLTTTEHAVQTLTAPTHLEALHVLVWKDTRVTGYIAQVTFPRYMLVVFISGQLKEYCSEVTISAVHG